MPQSRDEAGNIWEVDAQGNVIRLVQAAQQGRIIADPSANSDAASAGASAAVDQATIDARIRRELADAVKAEADARLASDNANRGPAPTATEAEAQRDAEGRARRAGVVRNLMGDVLRLYQEDIQGQPATRLFGATEYLPTPRNERFTTAGSNILPLIRPLIAQTAREGDSNIEMQIFQSYIPAASDSDITIEYKLRALETLISGMTEGRAPSQVQGEIDRNASTPLVDAFLGGGGGQGGPGPSVFDQTYMNNAPAAMQASGDRGVGSVPIPDEMQREHREWVLANAATMTPDDYASFRLSLDQKYGFEGDPQTYAASGQTILDTLNNGGTLNLNIGPVEVPLSGVDRFRNDLVDNPVSAAGIGFANMLGVGGVQALAGDQYDVLSQERPGAVLTGEVLGAMGGATGLGRLVRAGVQNTVSRAAPSLGQRLLGGGGRAQFGRNLGADVAYSGAYGEVTEGDPTMSAVEGGIGSALGQGAGRVLGGVIGGVNLDPAVSYLRNRGVPLTTGQTLGGMASRFEERAMSVPLIGDMIRQRRIEGIENFNRQALNEAGAPIGFVPNAIGQEGVEQLQQGVGDAYTNATAGVNVPLDAQFLTDLQAATNRAATLPRPERRRLGQVLDARVQPIADQGAMTGETFQQALRGLRGARNSNPAQFAGFEDFYRDAVTGAEEALTNQMIRGGGQDVVSGLQSANAANRNLRTVEDAANRNMGGSNTDTPFVFTPNQLQRAGLRTQQNFPGPRPFAELADNAQQVLPNTIPNSGTADRAMQALIPGLLAGGGTIGLAAGGDAQSAGAGAAIPTAAMILAALGGTRQGQRLINATLTRPAPVQRLGEAVRRNSGLFGRAAIPLALTN